VVQIRDKKQRVEKKYDKKLPVKYSADEKLLRIVFQNLLSNAIKYTPAQGKISLSIWPEKDKIKIEVKDTGMGIPKNQQAKIFEKLFRADNVRATDTEGTGLGLYIVKALMDAIKGKINFQSVENKGTTFWIEMPATGWQKKQGTKTIS
jgi:signal transduction histidine kinase